MSLEDMSAKFNASLTRHGKEKLAELKLHAKKGRAAASQTASGVSPGAVDGTEEDGTADRTADGTEV
jgi:hypothetical protein